MVNGLGHQLRIVCLLIFACLSAVGLSARAGGLDVRSWLERPGTRLVAVEFYATWCKPCMEAVPRWRELHERYRDQGLRLIVVSTLDPEGQCVNPGWNPDDMVCDPEGEIADAFKLEGRLPAAFLWSWQGNLLVSQGHVHEVEAAVADYLKTNPRILVEATDARKKPFVRLRDLIRAELGRTGKLTVVATAEERRALARIRKRSYKSGFDDRMQCQLGQEVSANSLLRAAITGRAGKQRLALSLFSAESACLLTSATAPWNAKRAEQAVAEALDKLLARLRHGLQMPGLKSKPQLPPKQIPAPQPVDDAGPLVLVQFDSKPAGAVVMVDDKLLCPATPCARSLTAGAHRVQLQKERYAALTRELQVQQGMKPLLVTLAPDFGWLVVASQPPGMDVRVDGKVVGQTPLTEVELGAGPHEVVVADARHHPQKQQVRIQKGEKRALALTMKPILARLVVLAKLPSGDEVAAEATLDGKKIGQTPLSQQVIIGPHELSLVATAHGAWQGQVEVKADAGARVEGVLMGALLLKRSQETCLARAKCVHFPFDMQRAGEHLGPQQLCALEPDSLAKVLDELEPDQQRAVIGLFDAALRQAIAAGVPRPDTNPMLASLKKEQPPPTHYACPDLPSNWVWLQARGNYFPDYILNHRESPFVTHRIRFRIGTAELKDFSDKGIENFIDERFNAENGFSDPDLEFNEVKTFIQLVANNAVNLAGAVFELTDAELGLYDKDEIKVSQISSGFYGEINETLPSARPAYVDVLKLTFLPDPYH